MRLQVKLGGANGHFVCGYLSFSAGGFELPLRFVSAAISSTSGTKRKYI
jgi:hypothetical protein